MVELLLATGLGLLLTLLAASLLLASAGNYRHHAESALLDDSGRAALDILAQAVRQGAYVNWDSTTAPVAIGDDAAPAITGWDARSLSRSSDGIAVPLPAVANGSDVLAVRFAGHGQGVSGDGSSVNCGGFGVAAPSDDDALGWSIFYVALDDAGNGELRCKYLGNGNWGADAIVRGVDSFQVLYGLDTDQPADGVPNRYLNASAIRALDAALVPAGATAEAQQRDLQRRSHWKRVCTVRLALLLHGDGNTRSDTRAMQFDLFGPAYAGNGGQDRGTQVLEAQIPQAQRWQARRLVGLTVALRNRSG
ncbi:pilus assembly protein PilW [Duganella sp. Leaf126]|nr:pilus assembly protein PilW [Duganella sp. Leaf126]